MIAAFATLLAAMQAQPASIATPPEVDSRPGRPLGVSPYPAEALRRRQEGTTVLSLHVSAKGRVTSCAVSQSSGAGSLDQASCTFARTLRYRPARDAKGNAVPAETSFPMHWRLPPR
jgi:periplasmic protein TonB